MYSFGTYPNFIDSATCDELVEWFDKRFEQYAPDAVSLENIRQLLKEEISKIPQIREILLKIEKEIDSKCNYNVLFEKLWLVKTQSTDTDKGKLPYIPHFDKKRYLKGMLLLD